MATIIDNLDFTVHEASCEVFPHAILYYYTNYIPFNIYCITMDSAIMADHLPLNLGSLHVCVLNTLKLTRNISNLPYQIYKCNSDDYYICRGTQINRMQQDAQDIIHTKHKGIVIMLDTLYKIIKFNCIPGCIRLYS